MVKPLSILCVHGIGHGDFDPDLEGSWSKAICDGLVAWNLKLQGAITCDFLKFDSLFEVPDKIRWTASMVAQWVSGGINDYPDPANRLDGCVNDVFLMSSMLQESGFAPEDIRVVLNDRATAAGITDRLHWLLDDVQSGDTRVLFYSGHGAQMPVYGPTDEADRMDECLVPYDFDWTPEHAVTDKQFLNLYSQLPYDSHFAAIFDCCHSGGMTREGARKARGITPPDDIRHRALRWNAELQMWEDRPYASPNPSPIIRHKSNVKTVRAEHANVMAVRAELVEAQVSTYHRIGRTISLRSMAKKQYDATRKTLKHHGPYLPIILEACQEEQLSYEYRHGTQSYGAFTYSLAATLRASRGKKVNPSFVQLMDGVDERLRKLKYQQVPNLVGQREVLREGVPWGGQGLSSATKGKRGRDE